MSVFHDILSEIDEVKTKLTDGEYKKIVETIAKVKKTTLGIYRIHCRVTNCGEFDEGHHEHRDISLICEEVKSLREGSVLLTRQHIPALLDEGIMESILIKKILEKDQRYGFNLLSWTEDRLFSKAEEEEMDLIYPLKKREIKFSIDRQEVLIYSMTLL
jgi:ABC-type sugar transport system ATPase subunit